MKKWVIAVRLETERQAILKDKKRKEGTINIVWISNVYKNYFSDSLCCVAEKRLFLDRELDEILLCEADISISEIGQIMGGN